MIYEGACHCGKISWTYEGAIDVVLACNCTVCRRYGVLWAYGYDGEQIRLSGSTKTYERNEKHLAFHFCADCACVAYWRSNHLNERGQRRIGINVRLIDDPSKIAAVPIDHFDGLETFESLPEDGKCVRDLWF